MYVHINLNISTYVNVPHMYAYMCISFMNISTFVDVPHMCIYVHINLNLSTYVDVPHMCVYMWINATKRTRRWAKSRNISMELNTCHDIEQHLHLLYRGQSTLLTYLKNVWCSTLHFQRCLQAVLLRASKKNEVSLHCERRGKNTSYWLWHSPEGSPPQGSRNPSRG